MGDDASEKRRRLVRWAELLVEAEDLQDYGTTDLPDLTPYLLQFRAKFDRAAREYVAVLDEAAAGRAANTLGYEGAFFQGGPRKDGQRMVEATAALRDEGGLPGAASLMLTQLLLNLGGHTGRAKVLELISAFLDAADIPAGRRP